MISLDKLKTYQRRLMPIAIAMLFFNHAIGVIGLNTSATVRLFESLSAINLLLSAVLIFAFHHPFSTRFFFYCVTVAAAGLLVEIIGVHSGFPFGSYSYSTTLGPALYGVPLIIGINWLMLSYCCSIVAQRYFHSMSQKVIAGASLMMLLDVLLEPFATRHLFWQWHNETPPIQNFAAWFIISLPFQYLFFKVAPRSSSPVALAYVVVLVAFLVADILPSLSAFSLNLFSLVIGFAGMEIVAHLAHKYLMHGVLWSLHRSHHQKKPGFFEKNDLYFILFALPGIALIISGVEYGFDWKFFLGLGIALYGLTYLIVHDIVIHQRIKWLSRLDNPYIKALRRAHKAHHADVSKDAAVSYGMLWVDKKYFDSLEAPGKLRGQNLLF